MKLIAPDYYSRFSCLMGECRHSCCRSWEIDIDEDTLEYYKMLPGELGERIRSCIREEETGASFVLTREGDCPFLRKDGLCEIILTLGTDAISDICDDHPRFRNFYSGLTEIGLGLCCEAAGKLILENEETVSLVTLEDDGEPQPLLPEEARLLNLRERLISMAQNRKLTVAERVRGLESMCGVETPELTDLPAFCRELECLDPLWCETLDVCDFSEGERFMTSQLQTALEQILVYIIYRNLPQTLEDGDVQNHLLFCTSMFRLVCAAAAGQRQPDSLPNLIEICRLWSSEIEYSDENPERILRWLSGKVKS